MQSYRETITKIEDAKVDKTIIAALEALQKEVGSYAAENAGSKDGIQDTTGVSEKDKALRDKLVAELIQDIKSKIRMADYTGTDKAYLEGAIKHVEYLSKNVIPASSPKFTATGWYDGNVNVYIGSETEDDVKVTILHEYLHHVNYLLKIHEYRYEDEAVRKIYIKPDDCFFFDNQSLQEIYDDFSLTFSNRMFSEGWKDKYSDLTAE